jgi:hypothetical protein
MTDSSTVLQAHALQSATVTAALLHGSRRTPRELARPYGPLVAGVVLGLLLLVAVAAAVKIDAALDQRRRPPTATAPRWAPDALS